MNLLKDDKIEVKLQYFYDHLKCQLGECQDIAIIQHEHDPKKSLQIVMSRYEKLAQKFLDIFGDVVFEEGK